jgi:quinol monooxygenase YgiN
MIIRVVNMKCVTGMEEGLKQLGREVLVPVNKEAGCVEVYFLEPSIEDHNPFFGVVSVWEDKDRLNNMKNSERYRALLQDLAPFIESLTDNVYTAI